MMRGGGTENARQKVSGVNFTFFNYLTLCLYVVNLFKIQNQLSVHVLLSIP